MGAELERRWDDDVETAWTEFRRRLADRLAELTDDEHVVVEVVDEVEGGAAPCCEVVADDGTLWLGAVGKDGETVLAADVPVREADRAAVMIVRALREVFAVIHPAWLSAGGLEPTPVSPVPEEAPAPAEPGLLQPASVEQVRAAVDLAVADLYDTAPEWDDDGDLPLVTDHNVVWVSVNQQSPRILLHCCLLGDVVDEAAALREVNRLNQQEFGLAFVLRDGRISVAREIALHAVVPAVLRTEAERLVAQVDEWASALAERLAAPPATVPSERDRFATAYAVMQELERDRQGSVDPATMARIFEHDPALLLRGLREVEKSRREAREKIRAADEAGRVRTARLWRSRQTYLRDLTRRMRAGLRVMVSAPARKPRTEQRDQPSLFDDDQAGSAR